WVPRPCPDGTGFLLPKGSDFVLQLHYHRNGRVERDRTRVGLYFAKKPVDRAMLMLAVPGRFKTDDGKADGLGYIPAGDANFAARGAWYVLEDCTVHAVMPHAPARQVDQGHDDPAGRQAGVIDRRAGVGLRVAGELRAEGAAAGEGRDAVRRGGGVRQQRGEPEQ